MTAEQKQCLLRYLGYYYGDIDGIYGQQTKAAVERFQEAFGGIVVDGLAGDETDKAMRHAVAYGMPGKEPDTKPQTGTFWDDIKYFTRDEAFLREVYAHNARFLAWCRDSRRLTARELYTWNTTSDVNCRCDESGMDNSPASTCQRATPRTPGSALR